MNNKIKILVFSAILISYGFFFAKPAQADYWNAAMLAAIWTRTMEKIDQQIHGVIMGALKQAAAEMINNTVNTLITGRSVGGALYVTDWRDFIYQSSQREANLYTLTFFDNVYGGRRSGLNYVSQNSEGIASNYYSYLYNNVASTISGTGSQLSQNIYNYCQDPFHPFAQNNFRCLNFMSSNPMYTPAGAQLTAESINSSEYTQRSGAKQSQSIAYQGFKPQTKNGLVVTPGSIIKDIKSSSDNIGNMIIATAKDPPEIISSVLARIVTATIQQGIGMAQRNIQSEINNTTLGVRRDVLQSVGVNGPGAIFKPKY